MKAYFNTTSRGFLIACVSALVLVAGSAYAGADAASKPCLGCKPPFHPPTHGHHAKIKPGQKVELKPGRKSEGNAQTLDANNWPGPHPGIGGGFHAQQQSVSTVQRTGQ